MAAKPPPAPAAVPADDDDDFDPSANAPRPPKAPNVHPVVGDQAARSQGSKEAENQGPRTTAVPSAGRAVDLGGNDPGGQGSEAPGRLSSAERPKLGSRVDPWIKQALKIAAAVEGRKEEALVEQALTAYLWQLHPELAAQIKATHERKTTQQAR